MQRRRFIKTAMLGTLTLGSANFVGSGKTHVLTLSFDDGFKKSFYKIAEIHEKLGLSACLNVIASAHLPGFVPPDEYQAAVELGDFNDWNYLQSRGHEIMPHTWAHLNLTRQPQDKAEQLIVKCLDYFEGHLDGFDVSKAVYNFAFNASTPELETYALTKVRAVRTGTWNVLGDKKVNPFPGKTGPFRLGCISHGPGNADDWVEKEVNAFLAGPGGWLVINLHGLDDEGWGPVSSTYLTELLGRLVKVDTLDVLPAGRALDKYAG